MEVTIFQYVYTLRSEQSNPSKPPKWIFNKANWNEFSNMIHKEINQLKLSSYTFKPQSTLDKLQNLTKIILKAAESFIPRTTGKIPHKQVPWWNEDCYNALRTSKRAFNRYKRHPTPENFLEFKKLKAITRKTFKESRKLSWTNFVSSINQNTTLTKTWTKIKNIAGIYQQNKPVYLTGSNNRLITSTKKISNIIGSTFAKNSSNLNFNSTFLEKRNSNNSISSKNILKQNSSSNPQLNSAFLN